MIITSYNIFQKVTFQEKDISNQYQRAYNADKYYLESNIQTIKKDDYEKVIERINLEKYAIDNNIKYNILLNSQNKNAIIPQDARILLMKVFDNFAEKIGRIPFIVGYDSGTADRTYLCRIGNSLECCAVGRARYRGLQVRCSNETS